MYTVSIIGNLILFVVIFFRKLVHRVTTPDLMFGQMVAPPPPGFGTSCVSADDMLKCFHDTGSPATSELSPVAVSHRYTPPVISCMPW